MTLHAAVVRHRPGQLGMERRRRHVDVLERDWAVRAPFEREIPVISDVSPAEIRRDLGPSARWLPPEALVRQTDDAPRHETPA